MVWQVFVFVFVFGKGRVETWLKSHPTVSNPEVGLYPPYPPNYHCSYKGRSEDLNTGRVTTWLTLSPSSGAPMTFSKRIM